MKTLMLAGFLLVSAAFLSCKEENKIYKSEVTNLETYVDSVDKLGPQYTASQWAAIDDGYRNRLNKIESSRENDTTENNRVAAAQAKYSSIETQYKNKVAETSAAQNQASSVNQKVRTELLGEGKPGTGDSWDFVTPQNAVQVYEDFVEKVRRNGDNYKDEDWAEVRALWKGLNARKDQIDKDMSTKDNAKVAGLRVAFTAIKSVNKPVSEIREEIDENKKKN